MFSKGRVLKPEEVEQFFLTTHPDYLDYPGEGDLDGTYPVKVYLYEYGDNDEVQLQSTLENFRNSSDWEVLLDIPLFGRTVFLVINRQKLQIFNVLFYSSESPIIFEIYRSESDFQFAVSRVHVRIEKMLSRSGNFILFDQNRTVFPSADPDQEVWLSQSFSTHIAFYNKDISDEPCLIFYKSKIQFDRGFKLLGWNQFKGIAIDCVQRMIFHFGEKVVVYIPDLTDNKKIWLEGDIQEINPTTHEVRVANHWFHYGRLYKTQLLEIEKSEGGEESFSIFLVGKSLNERAFIFKWDKEITVIQSDDETSREELTLYEQLYDNTFF